MTLGAIFDYGAGPSVPTCTRCGKTQPTAEVTRRRLHGAPTCKDEAACTRHMVLVERAAAYHDERLVEEIYDARQRRDEVQAWLGILRREEERRGLDQGNRTVHTDNGRPAPSRGKTRTARGRTS